MTKNIIIIFLCILFLTIVLSSPANEVNVPVEDRANFGITKFIQNLLGKVQNFLFGNWNKNNDTSNKNNITSAEKPMENNDFFQGDILLTEKQADKIVDKVAVEAAEEGIDLYKVSENDTDVRLKRKILASRSNWQFPIKFYIANRNGAIIRKALKGIEKKTCVRFEETYFEPRGRPGLKFMNGVACYSFVGRIYNDKFQDVSIPAGCDTIGKVQHEVMHALGSEHEQCRTDRDDYITIFKGNVKHGMLVNYDKIPLNDSLTYGAKYEYGSNMHYRSRAFGINDLITMLPKNGAYNKTIGTLAGLTFLDAKLLNLHYCSKKCETKIKCYNGGYQNPNKCGTCKCVKGYSGSKCTEFPPYKKGCGEQIYFITQTNQTLTFNDKKNCLYHLKAPHGERIKINIDYMFGFFVNERFTCDKKDSVEVKFLKDKVLTGALICQGMSNLEIHTENDHAIIHLRSAEDFNKMNITFSLLSLK